VICASPEYIERFGLPVMPSELSNRNCLLFSYSGDTNKWTLNGENGPETVLVSGSYRVNNSEALLEAIKEGIGIGRIPTFVARPGLVEGEITALLDNYQIPDHTFYAVFPEREYLPAKVRAFLDFAVEYIGGDQPYWDS
jgi:DNA-binding transcriptional LysR family regulator